MTLLFIGFVFLFVWGLTVTLFISERRSRSAIELQLRAVMTQIAQQSAAIANQAADLGMHAILKEKIRPIVHAVDHTDAAEHRQQVLARFKTDHPDVPWEHAERAMHAVLKESNSNGH